MVFPFSLDRLTTVAQVRGTSSVQCRKRVGVKDDGPANVKSFKVNSKFDAEPRRARARKNAPRHSEWMINHAKILEIKDS